MGTSAGATKDLSPGAPQEAAATEPASLYAFDMLVIGVTLSEQAASNHMRLPPSNHTPTPARKLKIAKGACISVALL